MKRLLAGLVVTTVVLGGAGLLLAESKGGAQKKGKSPEAAFKKHDKDANGKLTVDEFKGKKTGDKATKAEKKFQKLDANGDGAVTLDEFKATPAKKKNKAA